ncbi:LAGLIDADG family homing endonuclease [Salinigranum halophilum]|uniref:LAGLIDADG family homing endonuclease n=1 Tax=Salinigranum halophilum TaxID=2565931 RepID=UPI0010A8B202|nr:LAGLIDADG family homing endonuclease [Salinigranum halophilum]
MAQAPQNQELTERFIQFYRNYYRDEIGRLAQRYPNEQRSLYVDYNDLYTFDPDLAEDYLAKPDQLQRYAEEALRLYDLPADVSLGQAHVRLTNIPDSIDIRNIRVHDDHIGKLVSVQGIVRKATDVRPKITEAAFECQRCGTMTYIPQQDSGFQEPHECQGCERQGPFRVNFDQSEFVDSQKIRVQESPEDLRGGETPQSIDINIEDDITGKVTAGDHVTLNGVLHIEQQTSNNEKTPIFDLYMDGVSITIEDEEFEDMEITEEDKNEIIELSSHPDIYDEMVASVAPSIYGYDQEKLSMILQLFSGVTKRLPDGSRIRGDLHMLLIGDPGTGKSQLLSYIRHIAPRSVYTSGKGSSAAGLTAAAVRDDFGDGQQWTLEAGALVLADKGIAAVDELDKMRCVTGETLVHLATGEVQRIGELARTAAESGTVERLSNGRTIRDFDTDLTAWTMTDDGSLVKRPVTAIHEYQAPDELTEVRLQSGECLTSTHDHPYFVFEDGKRVERAASELTEGDWVYVPRELPHAVTDGGQVVENTPTARPGGDVTCRPVSDVKTVPSVNSADSTTGESQQTNVYDLTVEGTHNFVANGMIVHNSEDRSAMHEALEQQSYHPYTEVLLSDGRRVDIGEFVDAQMSARPDEVVAGVDCEILSVDGAGVHSVDFETNETTKLPIDRVSRHEAPDEFVRVEFSNGRSVTVTPEHPMFVDSSGEVGVVDARDIEEGAFVPAPRKLPNSGAAVAFDDEPHVGKERDVDLPNELTEDLAEALGLLVAEGHSYAGSSHEVGFSNQDERLLTRMDQLMTDAFGLTSTDTTNAAGTVTKRWVSTKLYRWFERNVPELMATAREKRIPARVLGASEEHIRRFLVGVFAGDGGVESEAMALSTSSRGLADDYADALAKIGVASRIHYNSTEDSWKTYVMGDSTEQFVEAVVEPADERHQKAMDFVDRSNGCRRHHDVLPTSAAREIRELRKLVGLRLTGQFRPNLDEEFGVRIETVETQLAAIRNRIETVRDGLEDADDLESLRSVAGWSSRQLAERVDGMTTSSVHYAEAGGYDPEERGEMLREASGAVREALDEAERRSDALEERCDLRFYRVTNVETVPNTGEHGTEWVYDVTVEPTNTFVSQGVVLHNSISISKAGINATLKSRCSLLGAANPKYGRFDQYEPIGEQIDLEPALISRFDLIFTVTDQPDPEKDGDLADHILQTNYAGELNTQRTRMTNSNFTQEEVDAATEEVEPAIEPELLRKYIAHAKRNCYPTMTDEARAAIREFYVDLRAKGADEDAPVPVTARKLEALVRLAEASARVRLSDTVEAEDAERVIAIVRSCLEAIGVDPETGEFDADVIETGRSKTQRDRIKNLKGLISELESEYEEGAPLDEVLDRAEVDLGLDRSKAEDELEKLRRKGEVYEPQQNHLRTT